MSVKIVDQKRISAARRDLIICIAWLVLTPFAFWFGTSNLQNLWISAVPMVFGCLSVLPLLFSWAIIGEYLDAKNGICDNY